MLRNHLIFATRLFKKDGIYSVLNILGLALGVSVGIILLLYLQSELTYDQHFAKHKEVYRFTNHLMADGADFNTATTARELASELKATFPEIIEYTRFIKADDRVLVQYEKENGDIAQFYEENIWMTDSTVFKLFDHTFYEGDPQTALEGPNKAAITKSIAEKYFGNETALGKRLKTPSGEIREITAVISDLPENTHLKYEILLSRIPSRTWFAEGDAMRKSEAYWNTDCYTYLLLPPNYKVQNFHEKFPSIFDKTFGMFSKRINGTVEIKLQPLADVHFDLDLDNDEAVGNMTYIYAFSAVGLFIILLACINYMNMATARSVMRTGEMGVRKALGFSKISLFKGVLLEAVFLAFIAMIIAIVFSWITLELTPFNDLIEKDLGLNFLSNPTLTFGMLGITLAIGILSGIYPAIYIPSIPVTDALKSSFTGDRSGVILRKGLIIFQFVVSLLVITCTVSMDKQIEYMKTRELGFDRENVLVLDIQDTSIANHMNAIKAELLQNPNITNAATSHSTPGMGVGGQVMWVEKDSILEQQSMNLLNVGHDYLETLGIELLEGRDFFKDSDNEYYNSFIANESAVKEFGWGENAVGKSVRWFHGKEDLHIIGVVKDFNFQSLHQKIYPAFLVLGRDQGGRLHIRTKSAELPATIAFVKDVWTRFDDKHPFEYTFLDQEFAKQYRADQTQQRLISILSYICIFVSLLGLIGLSAFTASRKAKEISIRKVLGASVTTIIFLFSKDYFKLILIAFAISVPIANYLIVEWLSTFAYQVPIRWFYFAIPGSIVLLLGLLTVSIQSLKTARANPVDALNRE
ncbi:MAG: ABC transporter permease [Cyclobacteriaceae bacterium]